MRRILPGRPGPVCSKGYTGALRNFCYISGASRRLSFVPFPLAEPSMNSELTDLLAIGIPEDAQAHIFDEFL